MRIKILISAIVLIGLGVGGFFVWKNFSVPETKEIEGLKESPPTEEVAEEFSETVKDATLPEEETKSPVVTEKEEIIPPPIIEKKEEGPKEVSNTTRKGIISKDEIWSGQIDVTGDILVETGVTLTILSGTQVIVSANKDTQNLFGYVKCDGIENYDLLIGIKEEDNYNCGIHKNEPYRDEANHISITIKGILKAVGTEESRIVFKSNSLNPTIYDWNRFDIHNGILSYANVENYRILETRNDVEISHNNLKNMGECGICANSNEVKILFNKISYAGHELIDMHDSSPLIRSNHLGPNPNRAGIIIDGGSPQITANEIEGCGYGISFVSPPGDPVMENNTFSNNGQNIAYTY